MLRRVCRAKWLFAADGGQGDAPGLVVRRWWDRGLRDL